DLFLGGGGADTFEYDKASDSTPQNPDLIKDFTSGTDKIDVSKALKNTGIKDLNFTSQFKGQRGEAVLSHDAKTGRGSLAIDMSGNGKADLLLNTVGKIQHSDIVTQEQARTPTPTPTPAPAPDPAPTPAPDTKASLLATLTGVLQATLMMLQGLLRLFEKSPSGLGRR
ncbi:metalloprotease, partial [Pseudomonas gessardii]|uniref:M10 family metallopeptidase C-terminal domain-containing protein n=1 Tax=Pseudomonas gessardii TaxID=78544 RepID=UPI001F3CDF4B